LLGGPATSHTASQAEPPISPDEAPVSKHLSG
jgi:hypothetical protein